MSVDMELRKVNMLSTFEYAVVTVYTEFTRFYGVTVSDNSSKRDVGNSAPLATLICISLDCLMNYEEV